MHRMIVVVLIVLVAGCSSRTASYCVVGEEGGWTRLDERPAHAAEILANAQVDERVLLLTVGSVEWFARDDGAYLLCYPGREPVCGQRNYHVERTDDGWAAPFHYGISCP